MITNAVGWLRPADAAKALSLSRGAIYRLITPDRPMLVYWRVLPRKILISAASVAAYRAATSGGDFWEDRASVEAYSRLVQADIRELFR